jgi:hypothetical protein
MTIASRGRTGWVIDGLLSHFDWASTRGGLNLAMRLTSSRRLKRGLKNCGVQKPKRLRNIKTIFRCREMWPCSRRQSCSTLRKFARKRPTSQQQRVTGNRRESAPKLFPAFLFETRCLVS